MKARIVERNAAPLAAATVDAIMLDIIESGLRNARTEMDAVLFRTAMSPGIREQHDTFPLIADRQGRMIVGQFGSFIDGFLRSYEGTIEEGDVFLTNDPYSCEGAVSHLSDWLILLPIYHVGRLAGWAAQFGHMTDVGGKVPGSLPTDATTIFEEGVRIPPMKLYVGGVLQSAMLTLILQQVRLPDWNRSDLNAIIAACRTAERRVIEMCERFSPEVFAAALDAALARNRAAMGQLIQRTVSEDELTFEDWICDDGRGNGPYRIACSMRRVGEKVVLDWSGTDPQAEGSINFLLNTNMLKMFFGIYMIMAFDPQILFNDGFYDLVEVRIPEGCLLHPRFPAALSCRTHALGRIFDVMGGLLGQRAPDFICAAGFSSSPHLMYSGTDKRGKWFQLFQIGFGGIPGRPLGDGPDGHSLWPSFTNVPNEFLEAYFPLRIERYESIADSGGPGLHRGGNGMRVAYRFLEPGEVSIHDDRWLTYPWGVVGGEPGQRGRREMIRAGGGREMLPSKCDRVAVAVGDVLVFDTWGGGGWGDPLARPAALVAEDVARGLITLGGAARYGVALAADGTVDEAGTEAIRGLLRDGARPGGMFNRGPPSKELLQTCLAETGLLPPKPPTLRVPLP